MSAETGAAWLSSATSLLQNSVVLFFLSCLSATQPIMKSKKYFRQVKQYCEISQFAGQPKHRGTFPKVCGSFTFVTEQQPLKSLHDSGSHVVWKFLKLITCWCKMLFFSVIRLQVWVNRLVPHQNNKHILFSGLAIFHKSLLSMHKYNFPAQNGGMNKFLGSQWAYDISL